MEIASSSRLAPSVSNGVKPQVCVPDLDEMDTEDAANLRLLDLSVMNGKLYDRAKQISDLFEAFDRRLSENEQRELILVTGRSGTGKTALIQILREPVRRKGGFFISGKFDQLQTPEPYAPFVSAFTDFSKLLLERPEKIGSIRDDINDAIGAESRLLVDMLPPLAKVLGPQQVGGSTTDRSDAHNRFMFVFRKFLRAICSPSQPLVLFLDDLQWADAASLDLLKSVATERDHQGLVLIGTCRYNEVSPSHPLSIMLRQLDSEQVAICTIHVSNLSDQAVNEVVSDVLDIRKETSKPLADTICRHTDGNIFFVFEFIKTLHEKGHLYMDERGNEWRWADESEVVFESDPVKFMAEKMQRLPEEAQEVLKTASCIGAEFDESLLQKTLSFPVGQGLTIATTKGLIASGDAPGKHVFVHDSVQQAAYTLIAPSERGVFHQKIGRRLRENLSETELDRNIYIVVSQLSRGVLDCDENRTTVAALCLRAGEKAVLSSAFVMAAEFFNLGIKLLGPNHWNEEYDLCLSLYNAGAEAEYCSANFDGMDMLIKGVLGNAKSFEDKLRAYTTQVYAQGTRGCLQEAFDTGFDVLRQLGEPFPSKGRVPRIMMELVRTKLALRRKEDSSLLRLPIITNRDKISALRMLNVLTPYAFLGRPDFTPLISARVIRLTLNHGLSALSSFGFANYGIVLCGVLGDIDGGYRYGQLALRIVDIFHGNEWIPRVYAAVYGLINIWKKPLRFSLEPLLYAHRVGLETGDIEMAMLDAVLFCMVYDYAGKPLCPVEKEVRAFWERMVAYHQHGTITVLLPVLQKVLNLMGHSANPCVLTGEVLDEEKALASAKKTNKVSVILGIYSRKMSLAYLFHEYELAAEVAEKANSIGKAASGTFAVCLHYFYEGLTALQLAYDTKTRKHKVVARKNLKRLKKFAMYGPENCLNKVLLMEAELAAVDGNMHKAMNKYECSVDAAGEEGLLHEQALACERAGLFLIRQGNESGAIPFLTRARALYDEWGARAKVEHMNRMFILDEESLELRKSNI